MKGLRDGNAPPWLKEFVRRETERTAPIPNVEDDKDYIRQGAMIGHSLRETIALLENPQPTSDAAVQVFNENRRWLAEKLGKAAYLSKRKEAIRFFRGVLLGLKHTAPAKGDQDTDNMRRIVFEHCGEIESCQTQRAVADVIKKYLPQSKVTRWNQEQHAAFNNRVRTFCRNIGFQPAVRGRPAR